MSQNKNNCLGHDAKEGSVIRKHLGRVLKDNSSTPWPFFILSIILCCITLFFFTQLGFFFLFGFSYGHLFDLLTLSVRVSPETSRIYIKRIDR